MAEVKRKKGETFEALVRRFSKKIQQSGRLIQSRKIRYYEPKKSKTAVRSAAARRKEISDKREYLKKIGKLVDEKERDNRR
ncbi:MAG: 30S ribosomal protein S21 [Candidatus Buchananbacteria bacterium]|nr:30S ribosomal protein S21 [Candidatus Buchananbacteria bacterium]